MDDDELEETFSEWKNEVLKELRPFLVDKLESHKLFTHLRASQVLDIDDQDDIEAESRRRRRNEKLLDMIKTRGPEAFNHFCEAIRQNVTQLFILTKILNTFQKKKDALSETLGETRESIPAYQVILPVPDSPGGPVIPCYKSPEENIGDGLRQDGRPRSPPPAYCESWQQG